jgi:DNA-binding GntR family transcriptional regulator
MLRVDNEPLYAKASEAIAKYIEAQKLVAGDKLPPEHGLAEILGVSRSTIREGLRELELQRRITRIHGRGTIIEHSLPAITGLSTLESIESLAARQGWKCGTSNITIGTDRLKQKVAAALGRRENERATKIVLVKTHESRPIWLAETWVPRSLLTPETVRERLKNTIFDLFGSEPPDYAFSTVSASAATAWEALLLKIPRRSPLVVLTEVFYHSPEKALLYARNALIPNKIELQIGRRTKPADTRALRSEAD